MTSETSTIPYALALGMEAAHRLGVVDEEPKMKPLRVRLRFVLPSLKNEGEAVAVREDRDGRGGAARLQLEAEELLEERDGTWNVGDLEVEMVELHGEPFRAHERLSAVGPHRIGRGSKAPEERE